MTVKLSDHNMLQKVKISDSFSSQSYNKETTSGFQSIFFDTLSYNKDCKKF